MAFVKTPMADRIKTLCDSSGGVTACWPWIGSRKKRHGYGVVTVKGHDGKWKAMGAHRAAWEVTNGPIPKGLCVLHTCDNPPCVNPSHLKLGTVQENNADKVLKGRQARGDSHGSRTCPDRVPRGERNGSAKMRARLDEVEAILAKIEAAVKGCKHADEEHGGLLSFCPDCGSWREWHAASGSYGRWQRPHILRVGRASK